jgi:proprotein convertase P-domain-containing protein
VYAPFTGRVRPEGTLATLNGESIAGDWKFQISDTGSGDTGTLDSWELCIETTVPDTPTPVPDTPTPVPPTNTPGGDTPTPTSIPATGPAGLGILLLGLGALLGFGSLRRKK